MTTTVKVSNPGPYPVIVTAVDTESGMEIDDPKNCILDPDQETPEWSIWKGMSLKITEQN